MRVLINNCYGGFGFSNEACIEWCNRQGFAYTTNTDGVPIITINGEDQFVCYYITRTDPVMLQIFDEKGWSFVSGECAELKVVTIPDGCEYEIGEYDGTEWIQCMYITATKDELINGLSLEKIQLMVEGCDLKLRE